MQTDGGASPLMTGDNPGRPGKAGDDGAVQFPLSRHIETQQLLLKVINVI